MLSGALECVAAALCTTMSPQPAQPEVTAPSIEEVATPAADPEPEAVEEPASTSTDATDTEVTPVVADVDVSIEDTETTTQVVMVSTPTVQPLPAADVEAAAIATQVPMVATYGETSADEREIECLALNIYHEARGEPTRGRYAVAWVTVNRMQASQFPDTVCEVVYQKAQNRRGTWVAQFSWTLQGPAEPAGTSWTDAQRIAREVYNARNGRGGTNRLSSGTMYYRATRGVSQRNVNWFESALRRVETIGRHIFYRER